jgi:hypothetical protein
MNERYEIENLKRIVINSNCFADVLRNMGIRTAGGNFKTLKKYIDLYKIDISHFDPDKIRIEKLKNLSKKVKIDLKLILVENNNYSRSDLKKRLYSEGLKSRICELCGQTEDWNGKKMSLILDHINGIYNDNRIENLRIVCPNCNSTLDTHCGKNNRKKNKKLLDDGLEINNKVNFTKVLSYESLKKHSERRIVERPTQEQLISDINTLGYSGTGRKYGVSDNAIRKWKKYYEKYNSRLM